MRLPIGTIVLFILSILIFFGIGHRVLDRMRLTDKGALAILAALIVGSFIDIPITRGNIDTTINVGGAIVPIGVAIYLLAKAGTNMERIRAIFGAILTAGTMYYIGSVLMRGGHREFAFFLDPVYITPVVAGLIAYIAGRSRRAAFVAATMGVLLLDIIHFITLITTGIKGTVHIGGAGAFDSIVLSGVIAVMLAEIIGESRERLQGGPDSKGRDPELIDNLESIEYTSMLGVKKYEEENNQRGENNE